MNKKLSRDAYAKIPPAEMKKLLVYAAAQKAHYEAEAVKYGRVLDGTASEEEVRYVSNGLVIEELRKTRESGRATWPGL